MADTEQLTAQVEVPEQGGLPQMNVIADGTYTNQLFWLAVTFIALYIVVSRLVLPRVTRVIEDREEEIRGNLDKAKADQDGAEAANEKVEAMIAEARSKSQGIIADAKAQIQADIAKATADLDAVLEKRVAKAEGEIAAERAAAMAEMETVVSEVAGEIVAQLSGITADDAKLGAAVSAAVTDMKGAE